MISHSDADTCPECRIPRLAECDGRGYVRRGEYTYACLRLCQIAFGRELTERIETVRTHWPIPVRYARAAFGTRGLNAPDAVKREVIRHHSRAKTWPGLLTRSDGIALGPSVVIQGAVGTGKTYLAAAMASKASQIGFGVAFAPAIEIMSRIKGVMDAQRGASAEAVEESQAAIYDALSDADVLVLDDLGKEYYTEFSSTALNQIVTARYNAGRPTVVTTNLTDAQMRTHHVWDAIVSRLGHDGWAISMTGADLRRAAPSPARE